MSERIPPRFSIGETVEIGPTIWTQFTGMIGVVTDIKLSRHSHTLDKYTVLFKGREDTQTFWDIQLARW